MNARAQAVDPAALLQRVGDRIPRGLRGNVVVIGSIASAWAFRDLSETHSVATKDIDLLLRPALEAVTTAQVLGQQLLDEGWQPQFPQGRAPGTAATPEDDLPALRLRPPGGDDGWFLELLAEPVPGQTARRAWRRLVTAQGNFGLPSFRHLPVAVHAAHETPFGVRVARPACMALAHLIEHAAPDRTAIAGLAGAPARYLKDVGRAIALWWLAQQQSPLAGEEWRTQCRDVIATLFPTTQAAATAAALVGLGSVDGDLRASHALTMTSILAPHGTTLDAFTRAHATLHALLESL